MKTLDYFATLPSGHRSYFKYFGSSYYNKSHYDVYGLFVGVHAPALMCVLFHNAVAILFRFKEIFFWLVPISITYMKIIINIKVCEVSSLFLVVGGLVCVCVQARNHRRSVLVHCMRCKMKSRARSLFFLFSLWHGLSWLRPSYFALNLFLYLFIQHTHCRALYVASQSSSFFLKLNFSS